MTEAKRVLLVGAEALTAELRQLADAADQNSMGAIASYLQEQRAFVQGKVATGTVPSGTPSAQLRGS